MGAFTERVDHLFFPPSQARDRGVHHRLWPVKAEAARHAPPSFAVTHASPPHPPAPPHSAWSSTSSTRRRASTGDGTRATASPAALPPPTRQPSCSACQSGGPWTRRRRRCAPRLSPAHTSRCVLCLVCGGGRKGAVVRKKEDRLSFMGEFQGSRHCHPHLHPRFSPPACACCACCAVLWCRRSGRRTSTLQASPTAAQ